MVVTFSTHLYVCACVHFSSYLLPYSVAPYDSHPTMYCDTPTLPVTLLFDRHWHYYATLTPSRIAYSRSAFLCLYFSYAIVLSPSFRCICCSLVACGNRRFVLVVVGCLTRTHYAHTVALNIFLLYGWTGTFLDQTLLRFVAFVARVE